MAVSLYTVEVLLCVVIGIVCSFSFTVTSFGSAILFHTFWQMAWFIEPDLPHANDLVFIVGLYRVFSVLMILIVSAKSFKTIVWHIFIPFLPVFIGFTFLGVVVLVATPPMVLQTVMGIIFLAFAVLKTSIDVSKTDLARKWCCCACCPASCREDAAEDNLDDVPEDGTEAMIQASGSESGSGGGGGILARAFTRSDISSASVIRDSSSSVSVDGEPSTKTKEAKVHEGETIPVPQGWPVMLGAVFAGAGSGFLGGLFGTGGPPIMVFITIFQLDKRSLRGTVSTIQAVNLPILCFYLLYVKKALVPADWSQYVIVFFTPVIGIALGNLVYERVDSTSILRIILGLLVIASASMLEAPVSVLVALIVVLVIFSVIIIVYDHRKKKKAKEADADGGEAGSKSAGDDAVAVSSAAGASTSSVAAAGAAASSSVSSCASLVPSSASTT